MQTTPQPAQHGGRAGRPWGVVALLALLTAGYVAVYGVQQLINGLQLGAIYALIAVGYTMVYGVVKMINFAHGDVYMVGAYVAFGVTAAAAAGQITPGQALLLFAVGMGAAMAGCALLGALIERTAYRPLRNQPRLAALTTAIGVSLLLENLMQIIAGPNPRPFPGLIPLRQLDLAGIVINIRFGVAFVIALVMMAGLQYLVMRTRVGKAMRAVAFDLDAARLMGIDVNRVIAAVFMLGSALAAAAGVLVGVTYARIDPFMGIIPGLKAFVAAVLGGIGNIPGAMVGGLLMGMAEVGVASVRSELTGAVAFLILIIVLLFKPTGLLGERVYDKV